MSNGGPRRFTPSKDWAPQRMTSNAEECRKRLQTIEDEEMASASNSRVEDRSVSSLLGSMKMSPKNVSTLKMSPSPDSGSFSMGTADLGSNKYAGYLYQRSLSRENLYLCLQQNNMINDYAGGNFGTDFTDSLPSNNESRGVVRMVAKPRPSAPLPVRMKKEEKENLLPVRISAKARDDVCGPVRMTKEEREEKAPVRLTRDREGREGEASMRMVREEKENQVPHKPPSRLGGIGDYSVNHSMGERCNELQQSSRNNTDSAWSRRQNELQIQIHQNRRRSQEFEDRSRQSEESLQGVGDKPHKEKDGKLKREDKMMSDDLARVKVELGQRKEENRALGLRERLQELSGGGEPTPLTKTTSCPTSATPSSFQPQSFKSSQHQYQLPSNQPYLQQSMPQPQNLQRNDDPRSLLAAPAPTTARSLLQTPLPSKAQPLHIYGTPGPTNQKAKHAMTPTVSNTPREPTMPPPSMAISQQREQILMIRGKRYRVMKLLGKGGSSRVYEAFDELRNQVVAIKRVNLEEADDETTRGYINEIGMLEKLQGEDRIVRLFDHETVEEENVLFVIMEKGDTDLASLLKKYAKNEVRNLRNLIQ